MSEFNAHTQSHMEMVLDEVCNRLPRGGDHETRKHIANRLVDAARSGKTCHDDLLPIALRALLEFGSVGDLHQLARGGIRDRQGKRRKRPLLKTAPRARLGVSASA
jgi:hypothetical protein